ncbi:hypothetical protein F6R98_00345 [Candidatus Methylospira mobilis]|uniref:Uncharacterized protein n=1 Tax=Candidatus Methylospira mobilis TaxID=1808979 RepID=A0A5Q0BGA9_9GAMM|nr:hypothetical protein [Candidatus Methylospira mobilis]QFY41251.1 hypothetical protein F6R98_00345 [Candidatus Methylospira mobilis]WNV05528.1 hypothetical protein RP726_03700 [Candidatus Methylospira mobilis]
MPPETGSSSDEAQITGLVSHGTYVSGIAVAPGISNTRSVDIITNIKVGMSGADGTKRTFVSEGEPD